MGVDETEQVPVCALACGAEGYSLGAHGRNGFELKPLKASVGDDERGGARSSRTGGEEMG